MANQRGLAEQLFEAALAVRPADRAAFLDWECSGDPDLKQEVEALLAADTEADSFLLPPFEDRGSGSHFAILSRRQPATLKVATHPYSMPMALMSQKR
jgi:hypothetical protein